MFFMNNPEKHQIGSYGQRPSTAFAVDSYSFPYLAPKGFRYGKPAIAVDKSQCLSSSVLRVSKKEEFFSNSRGNLIRKILSSKRLHILVNNKIKSSNDLLVSFENLGKQADLAKFLPSSGVKTQNETFSVNEKQNLPKMRASLDAKHRQLALPTGVHLDSTITGSINNVTRLSDKQADTRNTGNHIRTNFFLNKMYQKMPSNYCIPSIPIYKPLFFSSTSEKEFFGKSMKNEIQNFTKISPSIDGQKPSTKDAREASPKVVETIPKALNKAYFLKTLNERKNIKLLNKKMKQNQPAERVFDSSYSKMTEINLITISLASANRIRQWAEKTLPNGKVVGEVVNPETVHYKTLKPIKGGLFCERIFGPLKDHECACGKKFNIKNYLTKERQLLGPTDEREIPVSPGGITNLNLKQLKLQKRYFCRVCDVEYTYSIIRRTQLGYIQLASPTTHVWFVKGLPSYISILLDMKKKHLQNVTYNAETLTLEHAFRGRQFLPSSPSSIFESWQKIMKSQYPDKYGATQGSVDTDNRRSTSTQNGSKNQDVVLTKTSQQATAFAVDGLGSSQKKENQLIKSTLKLNSKMYRSNHLSKSINQTLLYKQNKKFYYARIKPLERGYLDDQRPSTKKVVASKERQLAVPTDNAKPALAVYKYHRRKSWSVNTDNWRFLDTPEGRSSKLSKPSRARHLLWPSGPWFKGKALTATFMRKKLDKTQIQNLSNGLSQPVVKNLAKSNKKITQQKFNNAVESVYERLPLSQRKGWFNLAYYLLQMEQKYQRKKDERHSSVGTDNWSSLKTTLVTVDPDNGVNQNDSHGRLSEDVCNKLNSEKKNIFISKQNDMQLLMILLLKEFNSTLNLNKESITTLFKSLPRRMKAVLNFCLTNSYLTSTNPAGLYKQKLLTLLNFNTKVPMPLYLLLKAKHTSVGTDNWRSSPLDSLQARASTFSGNNAIFNNTNSLSTDPFDKEPSIGIVKGPNRNGTSLEFSKQFLSYSIFKTWKICLKLNSKASMAEGSFASKERQLSAPTDHGASSRWPKNASHLKMLAIFDHISILRKHLLILSKEDAPAEDRITLNAILASLEQFNLSVSFKVFANTMKRFINSDNFTKQIFNCLFCNKINKNVRYGSNNNPWPKAIYDENRGQLALTTSVQSLTKVGTNKKISSPIHKRTFFLLIKSLKKYNLNNFEKQTTKIALMFLLNLKPNAFDIRSNDRLQSHTIQIFKLIQKTRQIKAIRKLYTLFCLPMTQSHFCYRRVWLNSVLALSECLPLSCFARLASKEFSRASSARSNTPPYGVSTERHMIPSKMLDLERSTVLTRYFYFIKQNKKCLAYKLYKSLAADFELTQNEYLKNIFILKTYFTYGHRNKKQYNDVYTVATDPLFSKEFDGISKTPKTNYVNLSLNMVKIPNLSTGSLIQTTAFAVNGLWPSKDARWPKAIEASKPNIYFKNVKLWNPDKKIPSFCEYSFQNLFLKKLNSSLVNNIYCLSHREVWEQDKDWQDFAYYYYSPTNIADQVVPLYKNRNFDLLFSLDDTFAPTAQDYFANNQTLFASSGMNMNTSFSGAGLIQKLLNEFNYTELKKMDKQNRILLFEYNKHVKKLKKMMNSRWPKAIYGESRGLLKSRLEYYKACHIRDVLIRRTKLTRKIFNKVLGNLPIVNQETSPTGLNIGQQDLNNRGYSSFDVTQTGATTSVETNGLNMILTVLPVLPPVLRPVLKMSGQFTISDLNRLYQRIIYRNERLKKFLKDPALSSSFEMKYAQRLLQEAVDNLIQNGKSGVVPEKDARGRLLKSLSDILKGKQGRFRQYLLGKRVDYSGRSVIVVGPRLKLHECGIPKEMALVLYSPFLIKRILNQKLADTYLSAKKLIQTNPLLVSQLLREIMKSCPVLLNRAPTLHRLGFQAFQPKLVDGKAILLHPLVCPAFNADFDGDQMAVHVPITFEARAEAWKLMLARNNLLSPATGEPIILPSQDMVLGCYYLTTNCAEKWSKFKKGSGMYFHSINDVLKAYSQQLIHVHAVIWVHIKGQIENGNTVEQPLELRIPLTKYKINNRWPKAIYGESRGQLAPTTGVQLQKEFLNTALADTNVSQTNTSHLNYTEIYSKTHNFLILKSTTKLNSTSDSYVPIITNQIIRTTPGKIFFNIIIKNAIEKRPALLSKYSSGTGLIKNKLITTFELQTENFFMRRTNKK